MRSIVTWWKSDWFIQNWVIFRCRYDVSVDVKGWVHKVLVRVILLHAYETWSLRDEDVGRLSVFDHHCIRRVSDIWLEHRVFGHGDDDFIDVTILKHRLQWLGHVSQMLPDQLPYRALFSNDVTRWEKRRWSVYDMVSSNERKLHRTGLWEFVPTSRLES